AGKKRVLEKSFGGELNRLTERLKKIAEQSRSAREFTFSQLRSGLAEIIACFPIYRTYVTEETNQLPGSHHGFVQFAIQQARRRTAPFDASVFEFLEELLLLKLESEMGG